MKKLLFASTIMAAAAAMPLSAGMADQKSDMNQNTPSQSQMQQGSVQYDWNTARPFGEHEYGDLPGRTVENLNGREIGEIEEIVTGLDDETYAVVTVGGQLGIGEKEVAVQLDQLRRDAATDKVVVMSQKSEAELEAMPSYDKTQYKPFKAPNGNGSGSSGGSGG